MSWLTELARPEIAALEPYEHAAWEPALERLHANELPWRVARRCDRARASTAIPSRSRARSCERLAALYGVSPADAARRPRQRRGDRSADARASAAPGADAVIVCPPTFGMYAVAARIQGAGVVRGAARCGARL